ERISGATRTESVLITYMRTDSVRVAPEILSDARTFISKTYGKDYLPEKAVHYSTKKSSQDAHEAIRPSNLAHPPDDIKTFLNADQNKLYLLIWRRFIASQMRPALYDTMIRTSSFAPPVRRLNSLAFSLFMKRGKTLLKRKKNLKRKNCSPF
ncbi:MAG: topoisomerase 1 protein, partial [Parcubacteria group bacterium GW2011_GWF2_50_9]